MRETQIPRTRNYPKITKKDPKWPNPLNSSRELKNYKKCIFEDFLVFFESFSRQSWGWAILGYSEYFRVWGIWVSVTGALDRSWDGNFQARLTISSEPPTKGLGPFFLWGIPKVEIVIVKRDCEVLKRD